MNYIKNLGNVFEWVNNVLQNKQDINAPSKPVPSSKIDYPLTILDPVDWISTNKSHLFALVAAYKNLDYNYSQAQNIIDQNTASVNKLSLTVQALQSKYLSLKNSSSTNSKIVSIHGGDLSNVDTDERLYETNALLEADVEEGVFVLPNTGVVSGIRSRLGSNAFFKLERSNSFYNEVGKQDYVIDGSSYSYWSVSTKTPRLYRTLSPDFVWGSSDHLDGFSIQGTVYFEKPVLFSEVFLKPVASAPLVVSRISWTPFDIGIGYEDQFTNFSAWSVVTGTAIYPSALTLDADVQVDTEIDYSGPISIYQIDNSDDSANLYTTLTVPANQTFNYISKTFTLSTLQSNSSGSMASTTYYQNNRLDIYLTLAGNGIPYTIKLNWLNGSNLIHTSLLSNYTSSEFQTHHFPFYIPEEATSVQVQIGSETNAYDGFITFDYLKITLGENAFEPNKVIYKDASIPVPGSRVTSQRVSVTLTQKNPELDERLGLFEYIVGLKELDVRYKEYYPRASVISKKLDAINEIRQFSTTIELPDSVKSGLKVIVYPYEDDDSTQVIATPKIIYNTELTTPSSVEAGEIFSVFTTEEYDNGYTDDLGDLNLVLLSPKTKIEYLDGTDRAGQVRLSYPVHFRKFQFEKVSTFLEKYGITLNFDPNMEAVYGISDPTSRDAVLKGESLAADVSSANIIATDGYVPIRVTVQNDNFTAVPDINGTPKDILVYTVTDESLTSISSIVADTTTTEHFSGFDIWLANTKLRHLIQFGYITKEQVSSKSVSLPFSLPSSSEDLTLKQCIDFSPSTYRESTLFSWYSSMVTNGQINKLSNLQTVETNVINTTSYQTKHFPLVNGNQGCALVVYVDGERLASNNYKVNPNLGIIKLLKPVTGTITASYSYVVKPYSLTDQDWFNTALSNNLVLTRNKTDYETGSIPALKRFDPDPTSPTYYPVIEYYVSQDNQVVLSREFFKYGSLPSKITVEYDTLAIKPRFGVFVERVLNATTSPRFLSASFEYNDIGASFSEK